MKLWNPLTQSVLDTPYANAFQNRLDKHWNVGAIKAIASQLLYYQVSSTKKGQVIQEDTTRDLRNHGAF